MTATSFMVLLLLGCLAPAAVIAGNGEMVDETVQEMDLLNRQALRTLPALPQNGRVEIKARIHYEDRSPVFDIHEKYISSEREDVIRYGGGQEAPALLEGGKGKP